jgi:sec-independent protein translocase protein TatA
LTAPRRAAYNRSSTEDHVRLGVPELLILFGIAILIFGAAKLPQLGKGLGEGIRNFKSAVKDGESGEKKE